MWAIFALVVAEASVRTDEQRVEVGECAAGGVDKATVFDPKKQIGDMPSSKVESAEPDMGAELITIQYTDNFKILTEDFSKEQYILTQCGTTPPTVDEVDAVAPLEEGYTRKFFTIPLQRVGVDGTVAASFLTALGVEDRAAYVSQYAVGPCWQKAHVCGVHTEATFPAEEKEALDAVFMDCGWDGTCTNVNDVAHAIHISSSQDPGPLHSAEHIKFVAAFFNKEDVAMELFDATVASYTAMEAGGPVVAWISYSPKSDWAEPSFTISMATYKLHYVEAAGGSNPDRQAIIDSLGDYVTATEAPTGWTMTIMVADFNNSKAAAAEVFWQALDGVDAVIDETYEWNPTSYTYETFLSNFELDSGSAQSFISGKKVFRIDGTHSPEPAYGLDWFESRLAHPEWAVEGLKRVLHGSDLDRHFFRNIATGEETEVVSDASCDLPSVCRESDAPPAHIPTLVKPMVSDIDGSSDSDSDSDSGSDSIAAVVSSALFLWAM